MHKLAVSKKMEKLIIQRESVDIGLSKLGGLAHLKRSEPYPTNEEGFYTFLVQLNFRELKIESELLPQDGILSIFTGSISNNEFKYFFYPKIPTDLIEKAPPANYKCLDDADYSSTLSGKLYRAADTFDTDHFVGMVSEKCWTYKDPIYLKIHNFEELSFNIQFDWKNNYEVIYFGRISGKCNIEQLLNNKEECFNLGNLEYKEWKEKLKDFDNFKEFHQQNLNNLICFMSIPSYEEIKMVFGDSGRVEMMIMKDDLKQGKFDKMIVKYAPD